MIKFSPLSVLLLSGFFLLHSCSSSSSDKKQNVRIKWNDYFIAGIDDSEKHYSLGTDSLLVTFENRSDYKIDSAYLLFQNQGLFVHHMDTIKVFSVSPKKKTAVAPPKHTLGISRSIKVIAVYSKELEFRYKADLSGHDKEGDCYHCK